VFDADAPSSRLALEQLEAPLTKERLFRIARGRTGTDADADDLVSTALMRLFDPEDAPWHPEQTPFLTHAAGVMRQTWHRMRRKVAHEREVPQGDVANDPVAQAHEPAADDELHRRRSVARWSKLLEKVLLKIGDKHPLAKRLVDLCVRGIEEPSEQAELLGCSVRDVELAHKTLRYHGRVALEERAAMENSRMQSLRETTTKDEVTP
jgi:DNA-directed RNA polymerase specialized sigma24 family protein